MKPQKNERHEIPASMRFSATPLHQTHGSAKLDGFSLGEVFQVLRHWIAGFFRRSEKSTKASVGFSRPRTNVKFEHGRMNEKIGVARYDTKDTARKRGAGKW